jgi:hypothetical protein
VSEALFEVTSSEINGLALIFGLEGCEPSSERTHASTSVSSPVNTEHPSEGQQFSAPQIESGLGNSQSSAAFRVSDP